MELATGVEPVNLPLTRRPLYQLSYASTQMSERRDSNPRPSAWEADVLPLNYSRSMCFERIIRSGGGDGI